MGKQIGFIVNPEDETKFFQFIMEEGTVYFEGNNSKPKQIFDLPNSLSEKGWFQLYLCPKSIEKVTFETDSLGMQYINSINASVIEFRRTIIRENPKEITRGRLWLEMKYYDDNGNIVVKEQELNEWYTKLSKWIKKNLKRREIQSHDRVYKEYISMPIVGMVEQGYKLLG